MASRGGRFFAFKSQPLVDRQLQLGHCRSIILRSTSATSITVVLEHPDEVESDLRLIAIFRSRWRTAPLYRESLRRLSGGRAGLPRLASCLRRVLDRYGGTGALGCTPSAAFQDLAAHRTAIRGVDRFATTGMPASLPTMSVELSTLSRHRVPPPRCLDGLGAQHQVREVDVPRMRRHIRTLWSCNTCSQR